MEKLKKIYQRLENGDFSPSYPIGADSINVDMISGNNLEEEFHLGSPNIITFSTDENNSTIITEEYKNDAQTDNYYIMITKIEEAENDEIIIVQKLNFFKNNQLILKKTKKITFINLNDNLTIKEVIE